MIDKLSQENICVNCIHKKTCKYIDELIKTHNIINELNIMYPFGIFLTCLHKKLF